MITKGSSFKAKRDSKLKERATTATYSWNMLFMGTNAVAETLADKLGIEKSEFYAGDKQNSAAVRLSLAETRLVRETREFLQQNGVKLDAFARPPTKRSNTVVIAKNLPSSVDEVQLREMFARFGIIKRFLLPPGSKVTALIEMQNRDDAKKAFTQLAYTRLRSQPLYLEWAPEDAFIDDAPTLADRKIHNANAENANADGDKLKKEPTKILVRNIPFQASAKEVRALFSAFGELEAVRLPKKPGEQKAHRGFGFVSYFSSLDAKNALDALVHSTHLYGRRLVLEFSHDADAETDEAIDERRIKLRRKMNAPAVGTKQLSKRQLRDALAAQEQTKIAEKEDEDELL